MRNTLGLLLLLFFIACKSDPPKYKKSTPVQTLHAGQYIIEQEGQGSKYRSERYVLSPDGTAEWHVLKKNGRYGDFYLDQIYRGEWEGMKDSISVRFEGGTEKRTEVYDSILIRPDTGREGSNDTLWISRLAPGRALKRIAAFR